MNWQKYFNLKKIKPGIVITRLHGTIDFSNPNIPLEKMIDLFENDSPYLELTPYGEQQIYGTPPPPTDKPIPVEEGHDLPPKEADTPQKGDTPSINKPKKKKPGG